MEGTTIPTMANVSAAAMGGDTTAIPANFSAAMDGDTTHQLVDLYVILVGLFGVLDNTFVVVVIVFFTKMTRRISGLLILNQTLVDLAASAMLMVDYIVFYTYGYQPGDGWQKPWSDIYCRLFLSEWLQWGLMLSSTTNLVLINLDRYLAIIHPIFHKCSITKKNFAVPGIVIVWLNGPIYSLAWAIPSTYMEDGSCMLYRFHDRVQWSSAYGFSFVTLYYLVPLSSMIYFYIRMLVVLGRSNPDNNAPGNHNVSTAQKNLVKTLLFITLAFAACMTWDNVNWIIYSLGTGPEEYYDSDMFYYSYLLASFNACVNPFIYITNCNPFKQGVRRMLCRSKKETAENDESLSRSRAEDVTTRA